MSTNKSWRPLVILLLAATALWFVFGPVREARTGLLDRAPASTSTSSPGSRTSDAKSGGGRTPGSRTPTSRPSGGGIFDVLDEAAKRREQARSGSTRSASAAKSRPATSKAATSRKAASRGSDSRTDRDFTSSLQSALNRLHQHLVER